MDQESLVAKRLAFIQSQVTIPLIQQVTSLHLAVGYEPPPPSHSIWQVTSPYLPRADLFHREVRPLCGSA